LIARELPFLPDYQRSIVPGNRTENDNVEITLPSEWPALR